MPKHYIFEIGDDVIINDHAKKGMGYDIGKRGVILDTLEVSQYDYEILLEDGYLGRFKEIEINKLN